ncbi:MAG: hypothetical protein GY714_05775 [Desulfobacterales bacterium]|nr:hypothetical protein [Desulfobacterales bacterium]
MKHIKKLAVIFLFLLSLSCQKYTQEEVNHYFIVACEHFGGGSLESIKKMVDLNADVNIVKGDKKFTGLHFLSDYHQPNYFYEVNAAAKVIIEKGADVNKRDWFNRTPLHYAAGKGNLDLAEMLLSNGAKLKVLDNKGYPPIAYAVTGLNLDLVKMMVARGATTDFFDPAQPELTLVEMARIRNSNEIVEYLKSINASK